MARKVKRRIDGRATITVSPTTAGILTGELDLTEWSLEELRRGQRKSKNGRWMGKRPQVVPTQIHDELVKRTMSKAHLLLRTNAYKAVSVLIEVATDEDADPAVRIKAAAEVLDRALGKAPQVVSLDVTQHDPDPVATLARASVVGTAEQALELMRAQLETDAGADDIEDGEVVSETDDDEDEPEPAPSSTRVRPEPVTGSHGRATRVRPPPQKKLGVLVPRERPE